MLDYIQTKVTRLGEEKKKSPSFCSALTDTIGYKLSAAFNFFCDHLFK